MSFPGKNRPYNFISGIRHMPPVGMRIVKTAVAVFLCFCVNMLRGNEDLVFYSQLAAIWCMQDNVKESRNNAAQRVVGTLVGALFGLATILLFPNLAVETLQRSLLHALVISLMVGVILYATVLIRKSQAAYFSNAVFLSIVVNYVMGDNPYLYVWNRFLDTVIGIVIALLVNSFRLPRERHKDILFVFHLKEALLDERGEISGYNRVELNRMIDDGAQFTIFTGRTPASLVETLKDVQVNLPVVAMDGAALYDIRENRYVRFCAISYESAQDISSFLRTQGMHWFSHVIIDDTLVIYCQDTQDPIYNRVIRTARRSPYRNFVRRELPPGEDVVCFVLLDKTEKMEELHRKMEKEGLTERYKVSKYISEEHSGCTYIKIYNRDARRENMVGYLKEMLGAGKVVFFADAGGDGGRAARFMRREFEPLKWRGR